MFDFCRQSLLRGICSTEMFHPIAHTPNFSNQFVKLVKPQISNPLKSNWVPSFATSTNICHVYCFKESPGYATTEIQILPTGKGTFYSHQIERDKSHVKLIESAPVRLNTILDLTTLIRQINECKLCDGCGK